MAGPREHSVLPRLALVASNLVPLGGTALLGWSPAVLVALYVAESWVALLFAFLEVPFARLRQADDIGTEREGLFEPLRAKRGTVDFPGLPPMYARNLAMLPPLLVVGLLDVAVGVAVVAVHPPALTERALQVLGLGVGGLFVSRGATFYFDYVRGRRYREVSAGRIVTGRVIQLLALVALAMVVVRSEPVVSSSGALTAAVLVTVVAGKTTFDFYVFLRDHVGDDPILAGYVATRETEVEPDPVVVPDGEPDARVRPHRIAVAHDGLVAGLRYLVAFRSGRFNTRLASYVITVPGAFAVAAAVVWTPVFLGPYLALVGGLVLLRAAVFALHYGTREYRLYPDRLVVHDRWLDAPQASVTYDMLRAPSELPDSGPGTDAVTVELEAQSWADCDAVTLSSLDDGGVQRVLEQV